MENTLCFSMGDRPFEGGFMVVGYLHFTADYILYKWICDE